MGGAGEPALSAIEAALKNGKSVVTANKALIARHGSRLAALAEKHGGALNFEAAVGAAIPIVKTLREGLAGTGINRVYGILNGTCNYILTTMREQKREFAEVLAEAQKLGYAEADPSFDIDGIDAAHKLTILSAIAFGTKVNQGAVYVEGISRSRRRPARGRGARLPRQAARRAVKTETGIEQRVHPTMVPRSSSIAQVMDVTNAVTIDGEGIPRSRWSVPARAARRRASAVVADHRRRGARHPRAAVRAAAGAAQDHHQGADEAPRGRLLHPPDGARPRGTAATIATRLAEQKISIESIVQAPSGRRGRLEARRGSGRRRCPSFSSPTRPPRMRCAAPLQAVAAGRVITGAPQVIRIEKN